MYIMKKGLSDAMFIPKWTTEKFFDLARKYRFEGVELNFRENEGELTPQTSLEEANRLAHEAARHQIEIISISSSLFYQYPLSSGNSKLRKCGEEIGRRMIEFAAEMGVKMIKVLPGTITQHMSYCQAYKNSLKSLMHLGNEAQAVGVIIGVENVCNKFLPSPKEFVDFLNDLNHPSIKAYLDIGNALVTGYPEHFIEILDERIIGVHVKDYRESIRSFVSIMEGDTNWPAVMGALQNIPYQGYLVSTPPYQYTHGHERHMERYSQDLTAILDLIH